MSVVVQWKPKAREGYFNIIDYYVENGWNQAAFNFRNEVNEKINAIAKFPGGGRPTDEFKSVRYVLIGKYNRMYYMFENEALTILAFFDTRQYPSKSPF